MSNWSPNAQLASLQFSGLVALVMALQFLHFVLLNGLTASTPAHPILQGSLPEVLKVLPPLLGVVFLWRYMRTLKKLNTKTSWRSMLMILKDEYTLSVYRAAASKAFTITYCLGFLLFSISAVGFGASAAWLSADVILATLMLLSSAAFGVLVLFQLYREGA